jgi:hypothetical protein
MIIAYSKKEIADDLTRLGLLIFNFKSDTECARFTLLLVFPFILLKLPNMSDL